jgi:hypothetical protein
VVELKKWLLAQASACAKKRTLRLRLIGCNSFFSRKNYSHQRVGSKMIADVFKAQADACASNQSKKLKGL